MDDPLEPPWSRRVDAMDANDSRGSRAENPYECLGDGPKATEGRSRSSRNGGDEVVGDEAVEEETSMLTRASWFGTLG